MSERTPFKTFHGSYFCFNTKLLKNTKEVGQTGFGQDFLGRVSRKNCLNY